MAARRRLPWVVKWMCIPALIGFLGAAARQRQWLSHEGSGNTHQAEAVPSP